ncbi:hemolysin family protein [Bacteroidales bacterium OttesenSCG-928-K03]|nr:hemolysin family protein [Odoribacter sp. OttesenSCG-928-L07]MDL2242683.1 hemolysin family protein [Bacteroidales bacterium OttesenSCG-928-K03]
MEIFIIIGLILLNGFLSMSEIAVVSSRKARLEKDAKEGNSNANAVIKLIKNPDNFLSTIQIGITLIGILTGIFSGAAFADQLAPLIAKISFLESSAHTIAQVIIVILVTYLTLIFGELLPKRLGMSKPEKIAKIIAKPMHSLSIICKPFVWILSKSTKFFAKLFKISADETKVTEEEIKAIIQEGTEDGEIQEVEQDIVERVFNLGDRDVESIMTHRSELVWLDIHDSNEVNSNKIKENLFNMYPVSDEELDEVVGVVYLKDLFGKIDDENFTLQDIMCEPDYLPDTLSVYDALSHMKAGRKRSSIVIDEFGSVLGILTMQDIVEALVGTIPDIGEELEITVLDENVVLVDGQCSFYDFLEYFDMEYLYNNNNFVTLSGLVLDILEKIPKTGDKFEWNGLEFQIVDMDGARIDKIMVTKLIT